MTSVMATLSRQRPLEATLVARTVRVGPLSWRVPVRAVTVTLLSAALLFVVFCIDLGTGDIETSFGVTVDTLLGGGDPMSQFAINELRLPQTTVALLAGAALGLAGALCQTFARNPLASPDILGVTEGAAAGAVALIVLTGTGGYAGDTLAGSSQTLGLPLAAFTGGVLTAAVLYVLSWRRGIDGQRLVLIGIGLGAALGAVTSWLLIRARIQDAQAAQVWLNGSLNNRGWEQARPLVVTLLVLAPLAVWLVRHLNALLLGDDSARSLGVRLQTTQAVILLLSVAAAAVSVSAVGPLGFVALVVPQIALRLTGGSRPPLIASMVMGALLVVAADYVTRGVLPFTVPAGVVTSAIGAPYLIWLLVRANRKVSA